MWPLRWKFALTLKKTRPRNHIWFAQRHVSLPHLHLSKVVKSVSFTKTAEDPGALYCTHNRNLWKISLLGKTSGGFPWRLLPALSHSHDVIFCPCWPWPGTAPCFPVHFLYSRFCPRGTLMWIWLERFYLESPSESVVKSGQLISFKNRPLHFTILILSCVKYLIRWSCEIQ